MSSESDERTPGKDFIRSMIDDELKHGIKYDCIQTRFPPEPNGYLHIGHAKAICLNFGIALEYHGRCNLRFDDTNPEKESTEYVDSIKRDVAWLGFSWGEKEFYSSDYFDRLYELAEALISMGKAYVDDQNAEQIRENRGTLTEPGVNSPFRDRSPDENMALFRRMKAGEFEDGTHVLRAKIDMASPNIIMRDPVLYRIRHVKHHRTGDKWCIYPMYDFCHCISDSIEHVTHSLCSLEFKNNRELYDWILQTLKLFPSHQTEFARLNLTGTVLSKRKLIKLVKEGYVNGWDDPRLPTISGLRRRGYTPESIREFCSRIGVAKSDSRVDIGMLEFCIREHLNRKAHRLMAVLNPVRVIIENYPKGLIEWFDMPLNQEDASMGRRKVPFSREFYIEREDFMENPPSKFFRLAPGREVRLRYAYYVTCTDVKRGPDGEITEIICTYDPESKGGGTPDGRKVKGTLHWVSASHALSAEVRLYDRLFVTDDPEDNLPEGEDFTYNLNPGSLTVSQAMLEPALGGYKAGDCVQFERMGYFCMDPDSTEGKPVFNRVVTLKDTWAKVAAKN